MAPHILYDYVLRTRNLGFIFAMSSCDPYDCSITRYGWTRYSKVSDITSSNGRFVVPRLVDYDPAASGLPHAPNLVTSPLGLNRVTPSTRARGVTPAISFYKNSLQEPNAPRLPCAARISSGVCQPCPICRGFSRLLLPHSASNPYRVGMMA